MELPQHRSKSDKRMEGRVDDWETLVRRSEACYMRAWKLGHECQRLEWAMGNFESILEKLSAQTDTCASHVDGSTVSGFSEVNYHVPSRPVSTPSLVNTNV
ncbi:hypothetical protein IWQ62_000328 [Dispira parvispora]|uniref:Uncharacterized protein n=1 Tax=Dispira parvispora TaxID=1520584 RepID=A0A9W8E9C7_9FUNG|nr:hypothetical protein IWQ62_000328 [Dispira parvispora]